jgi:hypothetical protein
MGGICAECYITGITLSQSMNFLNSLEASTKSLATGKMHLSMMQVNNNLQGFNIHHAGHIDTITYNLCCFKENSIPSIPIQKEKAVTK